MPSGKTHDRITLWTMPWVALGTLGVTQKADLTLLVAGSYLFSGLMFGPDLDIYSVQFKRWGWLRFMWIPYQKSLRHRSNLSHGFLIGTILRVFYLGGILVVLGGIVGAIAYQVGKWQWSWLLIVQQLERKVPEYLPNAIAVLIGLELGAMSHVGTDWLGSTIKRIKRQGWSAAFGRKKSRKSRKKR